MRLVYILPLVCMLATAQQVDWRQIKNRPSSITADATLYRFTPQAPGIPITGSSPTTVNMAPCPSGVAGADTGHYVYLSGGTGTAEAVLITGGTCTSGATSGTLSFTPANSHSGVWTIQTATGGIQEAVCALPSVGGWAAVTATTTLLANVSSCGKTFVNVRKESVTISGAFTILGSSASSTSDTQVFSASANTTTVPYGISDAGPTNWATLAGGVRASSRVAVNNFPIAQEFQGSATPTVAGLDGAVDGGSGFDSAAVIGIMGTARTNTASVTGGTAAVGVFGAGYIGVQASGGQATQAWGANFSSNNCSHTNCADGDGFNGNNTYGVEIDVNVYKTSGGASAANAYGLWVTGASTHSPAGEADGVSVGYLGVGASIPWHNSFHAKDGSGTIGFLVGTTASGNTVGSMPIRLISRDGSGTIFNSDILTDSTGNLILRGGSGSVVLEDSGGHVALSINPSGTTPFVSVGNQFRLGASGSLLLSPLHSTTGTRFLCVDSVGLVSASASACSGT